MNLEKNDRLFVKQKFEIAEMLGFETRNKYEILNEQQQIVGFAAEQSKGLLGFLFRQVLGHWRRFEILIFDTNRQVALQAQNVFRWYFTRIEVKSSTGVMLGAIEKRFSIITKRFVVKDERENVLLEVASPIWKFWTFSFMKNDLKYAEIKKKWTGFLAEVYTDKDNFMIEFLNPSLTAKEKNLILVSSIFIDLLYFERKQ